MTGAEIIGDGSGRGSGGAAVTCGLVASVVGIAPSIGAQASGAFARDLEAPLIDGMLGPAAAQHLSGQGGPVTL